MFCTLCNMIHFVGNVLPTPCMPTPYRGPTADITLIPLHPWLQSPCQLQRQPAAALGTHAFPTRCNLHVMKHDQ